MLMLHVVLAELLSETVNSKKATSSESWKIDWCFCKPTQAPWVSNISCSSFTCKQISLSTPSGHGAPAPSAVPALVICFWPGGFCWAGLMLVPSPAAPLRPEMTAVWHGQTEAASASAVFAHMAGLQGTETSGSAGASVCRRAFVLSSL